MLMLFPDYSAYRRTGGGVAVCFSLVSELHVLYIYRLPLYGLWVSASIPKGLGLDSLHEAGPDLR